MRISQVFAARFTANGHPISEIASSTDMRSSDTAPSGSMAFRRGEMLMPRPPAAMRKIREVLRLAQAKNLTPTEIAIAAGLPQTTVRNYLSRAAAAGLSWPLPDDFDDRALVSRFADRWSLADRLGQDLVGSLDPGERQGS